MSYTEEQIREAIMRVSLRIIQYVERQLQIKKRLEQAIRNINEGIPMDEDVQRTLEEIL